MVGSLNNPGSSVFVYHDNNFAMAQGVKVMEFGNPMEREELEKQEVWIPVTSEKLSLSPASSPETISGERVGQTFWSQPETSSLETNTDLKFGDSDHHTTHMLQDGRPDQEKNKHEMQCEGEKNSQSTPTQIKTPQLKRRPQQRPKKKKYWPKIADESKKARKSPKSMSSTPAPKTPKQPTPKKHPTYNKRTSATKRKPEVAANAGEATDPKLAAVHEHTAKSCGQVLDFALETTRKLEVAANAGEATDLKLLVHEQAAKSCRQALNFEVEARVEKSTDLSNMAKSEISTEHNVSQVSSEQNVIQRYKPLHVYSRRVLKPNKCQRNSRLLGPIFLGIFKRRRMERKKSMLKWGRGLASHHRLFAKKILPTESQITKAFGDPEHFRCIFLLSPAVKSKRKRTPRKVVHRFPAKKSKKKRSLIPAIKGKRKRSSMPRRKRSFELWPAKPKHQLEGSSSGNSPSKGMTENEVLTKGCTSELENQRNDNNEHQLVQNEKILKEGQNATHKFEGFPARIEDVSVTSDRQNVSEGSRMRIEDVPVNSEELLVSLDFDGSPSQIEEVVVTSNSQNVSKGSPIQIEDVLVTSEGQKVSVEFEGSLTDIEEAADIPKMSQFMLDIIPKGQLATPKVTPKRSKITKDPVDDINRKLVRLRIIEDAYFSKSKQRALVPFDVVKKRKSLPRVDLDQETMKVQLATLKVTPKKSKIKKVPLGDILRKLARLRINEDAYSSKSKHRALVPFDAVKKRENRPTVDLDRETMRVWRMLTYNGGSEAPAEEERDKDKEKWWEDQREMFRGRVDCFISRMHLIQGDRRFSLWKGSVLDSVVGVFLTQNVSDHLSSNTFMSLAARFPLRSTSNHRACNEHVATEEAETAHDTTSDHLTSLREESIGSNSPSSSEELVTRVVKNDASELQNLRSLNGENLSATSMPCTNEKFVELSCGETQRQISSSSGKAIHLEGAHLACSHNHFSEVPLAPDAGDMIYNLGEIGTYASVDKCQSTPKSSFQAEVEKYKMADASNSLHGKNKMNLQPESTNRKRKSKVEKKPEIPINWDDLRKTYSTGREPTGNAMDSLDWEAVRLAPFEELSEIIKERGMNNQLAARIKKFLNRAYSDHGSLNLEWLRDVPPDDTKKFLLSVDGLGLKSVECIRLLTLHHHAFPVDTNVGRIAVRLGWVPLQPLPGDIQMHLLEQYPVMDAIQKYLWPRLCTLDQQTLYELHYQMITFGKVFCTKKNPSCNACPLRGECRHFASQFASSRLSLPGLQTTSGGNARGPVTDAQNLVAYITSITESLPHEENLWESRIQSKSCKPIIEVPASPEHISPKPLEREVEDFGIECEEPIIELAASREPVSTKLLERDVKDFDGKSDVEIPTIRLNAEKFKENLMDYLDKNNMLIPGVDMSKALVALAQEAASLPVPKMKYVSRLKTMHKVYEVPDGHPLLEGLDARECDDPSPYLLAIWTSDDETTSSSETPQKQCGSMESEQCDVNICYSCKEHDSQTVPGTILIPCRTATRGRFPLNGTYFQINEVFADFESSEKPIDVPKEWLQNLRLRPLCCGTSASTSMKGFTTEQIQYTFQKGFICVRAFDRETRAPRPLSHRFHVKIAAAAETKKAKHSARKTKAAKQSKAKSRKAKHTTPNPA